MIFPHCITGLCASNRRISGHSRGLRTFSKGYGCSSTSLTNAITLRFRSCSWTCDQRDLWWIITAFMMMSLDSLLLASWWSTVFEEHSFLSQNNVALCLANRHSLVHPFLDVSLWVAGRLHISSSGSITSHHFPSHVFCTTNWSYRSRTKPWIHNFILHNPSFDIVGLKHPIWMVAVSAGELNWRELHHATFKLRTCISFLLDHPYVARILSWVSRSLHQSRPNRLPTRRFSFPSILIEGLTVSSKPFSNHQV